MNSVIQDSVSLGQKIITGKIVIFICLGIICIGFALYHLFRKTTKYNRMWGVVQKSQCHQEKNNRQACRLMISYHINGTLYTKHFIHDGTTNYFIGQPIELEYPSDTIDKMRICCKMSTKKLAFLFILGSIFFLGIAFFDYLFRNNKVFAISQSVNLFR
jgi:hypothetical protein